jgi:hypothetical protein
MNLAEIFDRHGIHPPFRRGFRALVEKGRRPSHELATRLEVLPNYRDCLHEILRRLSEPFYHLFGEGSCPKRKTTSAA